MAHPAPRRHAAGGSVTPNRRPGRRGPRLLGFLERPGESIESAGPLALDSRHPVTELLQPAGVGRESCFAADAGAGGQACVGQDPQMFGHGLASDVELGSKPGRGERPTRGETLENGTPGRVANRGEDIAGGVHRSEGARYAPSASWCAGWALTDRTAERHDQAMTSPGTAAGRTDSATRISVFGPTGCTVMVTSVTNVGSSSSHQVNDSSRSASTCSTTPRRGRPVTGSGNRSAPPGSASRVEPSPNQGARPSAVVSAAQTSSTFGNRNRRHQRQPHHRPATPPGIPRR